MKRLDDYLEHIATAIGRIEQYIAGLTREDFMKSIMTQDAVIRNIEIIGEAARNITRHYPAFAAANRHLRLANATKMRNAVSHGYFSVDLEIVWSTVAKDLPALSIDLNDIIAAAQTAARAKDQGTDDGGDQAD